MNSEALTKVLSTIDEIIEKYDSGQYIPTEKLRVLMQELSANYYRLTKFNIEANQAHNAIQYMHKGSVASGKILAEEQVPELRLTRKIMEACNHVLWSMRSELSIIKSEN